MTYTVLEGQLRGPTHPHGGYYRSLDSTDPLLPGSAYSDQQWHAWLAGNGPPDGISEDGETFSDPSEADVGPWSLGGVPPDVYLERYLKKS